MRPLFYCTHCTRWTSRVDTRRAPQGRREAPRLVTRWTEGKSATRHVLRHDGPKGRGAGSCDATAHILLRDGLIVPSRRAQGSNEIADQVVRRGWRRGVCGAARADLDMIVPAVGRRRVARASAAQATYYSTQTAAVHVAGEAQGQHARSKTDCSNGRAAEGPRGDCWSGGRTIPPVRAGRQAL